MVRGLVLVITLLMQSPLAWAWQEPAEFVGVRWGDSVALLKRVNEAAKKDLYRCAEADRGPLPPVACLTEFSWFNVPVKGTFRFRPGAGFVGADLQFWSARFGEMKRGLIETYGPPTQEDQQRRTTPGGLPYVNEVFRWHGVKVQMNLQRYPVDFFSDSEFLIMLTEEMERQYR